MANIKRANASGITKPGTAISDVPDAPTIGTATGGSGAATVTYTAAATGGTATTFTATSSPGSVTGTGASPITISGLTNGTSYTFTVTASNSTGSNTSSASNSVTPESLGDMDPIAMVDISSTTGSITFSSIPATYTHLQIRGVASSSRSDYIVNNYCMRFNADTGNNYRNHGIQGGYSATPQVGGNASGPESFIYMPTGVTGLAGGPQTSLIIDILDYANTNKNTVAKTLIGYDINGTVGSYGGAIALDSGLWLNTSAITSITLLPEVHSWLAGTTFALYGIKDA